MLSKIDFIKSIFDSEDLFHAFYKRLATLISEGGGLKEQKRRPAAVYFFVLGSFAQASLANMRLATLISERGGLKEQKRRPAAVYFFVLGSFAQASLA